MTAYYTDPSSARQMDGANSFLWWEGIPLASLREATSNDIPGTAAGAVGGVLNKATTPILEFVNGDTDSAIRLNYAADDVDAVTFQQPLPPNIDTSQPITIGFQAALGGTTDSLVWAADTFFGKGDTKVEDNSGTVSGTVVANYSVTIAAADIPNNVRTMSVELTPGAHANDTFLVYAMWVQGTLIG